MATRWSAATVVSALLVVLAATTASAQPPPGGMTVFVPGKRNTESTCKDDGKTRKGKNKAKPKPCTARCTDRCPTKCLVLCPGCITFCLCDFYPGVACGDPRFTGGDGNNFYFHGKKDQDFCVVADADLHINAHFIGNHNPATGRDFTWIQAIGVLFPDHHRLSLGALRSSKWNPAVDHLDIAFDDERVDLPRAVGARWSPATAPALSITRTSPANDVVVELKGVFRLVASAVPITAQESSVHNYGVTADDCLAHLDLGFRFQGLSDDVHGVLGQTYRSDYVSKLNVAAKMPVMGGAADFVSSGLFATDCAVARFGRGGASAHGIAMVTDAKYV
uniref:Uncharacterized protein n=1 Tax=Avena sativa TaxID=4498 RepID=A0ACD5TY60_AVESA